MPCPIVHFPPGPKLNNPFLKAVRSNGTAGVALFSQSTLTVTVRNGGPVDATVAIGFFWAQIVNGAFVRSGECDANPFAGSNWTAPKTVPAMTGAVEGSQTFSLLWTPTPSSGFVQPTEGPLEIALVAEWKNFNSPGQVCDTGPNDPSPNNAKNIGHIYDFQAQTIATYLPALGSSVAIMTPPGWRNQDHAELLAEGDRHAPDPEVEALRERVRRAPELQRQLANGHWAIPRGVRAALAGTQPGPDSTPAWISRLNRFEPLAATANRAEGSSSSSGALIEIGRPTTAYGSDFYVIGVREAGGLAAYVVHSHGADRLTLRD